MIYNITRPTNEDLEVLIRCKSMDNPLLVCRVGMYIVALGLILVGFWAHPKLLFMGVGVAFILFDILFTGEIAKRLLLKDNALALQDIIFDSFGVTVRWMDQEAHYLNHEIDSIFASSDSLYICFAAQTKTAYAVLHDRSYLRGNREKVLERAENWGILIRELR